MKIKTKYKVAFLGILYSILSFWICSHLNEVGMEVGSITLWVYRIAMFLGIIFIFSSITLCISLALMVVDKIKD